MPYRRNKPTISQTNGYFFYTPATAGLRSLFWTPENSFNPADYAGGSIQFSWYQGNANVTDSINLAIRIGTDWYVSTQSYLNTAGVSAAANFSMGDANGNGGTQHGGELKTLLFDPAAANWRSLSFDGNYNPATNAGTAGTDLTLGSVLGIDLPSGTINGFGWYMDNPTTSAKRLDTFTIEATAVPEPSTMALVVFGVLSWHGLRRRARWQSVAV